MRQESLLLCPQDPLLARGQGGNFSACLRSWIVGFLEGRINPDKPERLLLWKELTLEVRDYSPTSISSPAHSGVGNRLVSGIVVG